jgi:PhoPQ-activated pathogenicity-related protein
MAHSQPEREIAPSSAPLQHADLHREGAMSEPSGQSFLRDWTGHPGPGFSLGPPAKSVLLAGEALTLPVTSQVWRGEPWRHELRLYRPPGACGRQALLFLSGGARDGSAHQDDGLRLDGELTLFATLAGRLGSVVGVLSHTLHQPMFGDLKENALIAYSLDRFLADGDGDWPVLAPMVAAARRAMDSAQTAAADAWGVEIASFTLAGFSKRGWAAWLAAAVDPRVTAMVPIMMDLIDLPAQLAHQRRSWGGLSPSLEPFETLGLPKRLDEPAGERLLDMIDPVRWPDPGGISRLVVSASNDDYSPVDAPGLYLDRFAEPIPWMLIPNSRHGSLSFRQILAAATSAHRRAQGGPAPPRVSAQVVQEHGKVELQLACERPPSALRLWTARSHTRDLRAATWSSTPIEPDGRIAVGLAESGILALFAEAGFEHEGEDLSLASRVTILGQSAMS